jgi:thiopeptide-type bacteriocin biosynthesis protein
MADSQDSLDLAAEFFVLRTPLLPFNELEAWSAGLAAPGSGPEGLEAALSADRERLRDRLRAVLERPAVREALFVASPDFVEGLEVWLRDPEGKKGRRAEEALVRYFLRMTARATPFGLFSACSVGGIGETSRLSLAGRERYRRRTRLDMDYLFALAEDLERSPDLRPSLRFRPNSSLYAAAGRLRYAESRLQGFARIHQLVAADENPYLEEALRRAHGGATPGEIAQALVESDPDGEIAIEEAAGFAGELIDAQILVSDLPPPVTGREPAEDLADQLAQYPATAALAERLRQTRDALAELDAGGVGGGAGGKAPERYRSIAAALGELPARIDLQRLFQVDMIKPAPGSMLGPEVLAEIVRGLRLLRRVAEAPREDSLAPFRRDFLERYGHGRAVPLTEALDEEIGIGFRRSRAAAAEGSPLLAGLIFPAEPARQAVPGAAWHEVLLAKLTGAVAAGALEVEITDSDLAALPPDRLPPQPDAFQVLAALAAPSPEALARGDFKLLLRNAFGPSGVRLLGRFCDADAELLRHVEDHLHAEEALRPEAVFAEIVHLPEGRVGNILWRPVLRPYEIPYLGRSGAPEERQLPLSDLRVTVTGGEVVLSSAHLGRRVIPRLTSAHNFGQGSLGLYSFLGSLQGQGTQEVLIWSWGALDTAPFLPRVASGRLVLSRAQWRVGSKEIERLTRAQGADRYRAVQMWRAERRLPRWVLLLERDNELAVDLDNPLAIDAFLAVVRRNARADLAELFPGPDELCATGPEGRFFHELTIPFVRRRPHPPGPPLPSPSLPPGDGGKSSQVRRAFPPGSEWLYAKLYTGTATADRVLRESVAPLVRQALAAGEADRWFFLRFGDPDWHLRIRLHGDPRRLQEVVLPRFQETAAALLANGTVWRFQLDTYDREIERYGGPEGIELAEELFHADSDAVLAIVEGLEGIEGAEARWRLALRGIDRLLTDLGFAGRDKLGLLKTMQESSAREINADAGFIHQLAERLRRERRSLAGLLETGIEADPADPLAPGIAALGERSRRLVPLVAELQARERAGRLTAPLADLALSLVHMFANRLLRSEGRAHEVVLYDFLYRLHLSREAGERRRGLDRAAGDA